MSSYDEDCQQSLDPEEARFSPVPSVAGIARDTLFASSDGEHGVEKGGCIKEIGNRSDTSTPDLRVNGVVKDSQSSPSCLSADETEFRQSQTVSGQRQTISQQNIVPPSLSQNEENLFILSDAGKPIFTLHGKEEEYVTLFGIIQALVCFIEDPCISQANDSLQSLTCGVWKCTFAKKGPIILVATSRNPYVTAYELKQRTSQMYYLILSVLTKTQVTKIFETRKNYDLRKLLTGTEKTFKSLYEMTRFEPALALHSMRVFPMQSSMRDQISSALFTACSKAKAPIVFGLVSTVGSQLITMVRMKKYTLHADDVHLVLNMIECNPAFKQSLPWVPICLPRFDDSGFLHSFISYIGEDVCLVLLTVDRNSFDELREVHDRFMEQLLKAKIHAPLCDLCKEQNVGFKLTEAPYVTDKEQRRLISRYMKLIHFTQHSYHKGPLRILYQSGEKECMLAWVREEFELYATFSPLVTKIGAIARIDKILKWLKKDEDRIFLMNPLTF